MADENVYISDGKVEVEFRPAIEDYIHVSNSISGSVPQPRLFKLSYYFVYLLNAIIVPVILVFHFHSMSGFALFAFNVFFLVYANDRLINWYNRIYFARIYSGIDDHLLRVEASSDGISTQYDGITGFIPWKWFRRIEETETTVFIFTMDSAIMVRKSGFVSEAHKNEFPGIVRERIGSNVSHLNKPSTS
ncbi:MAG: YcxB family protein [Acidobacteria bacterium]|nr:YcxB family protein [Acidobacteriota bacterium]